MPRLLAGEGMDDQLLWLDLIQRSASPRPAHKGPNERTRQLPAPDGTQLPP